LIISPRRAALVSTVELAPNETEANTKDKSEKAIKPPKHKAIIKKFLNSVPNAKIIKNISSTTTKMPLKVINKYSPVIQLFVYIYIKILTYYILFFNNNFVNFLLISINFSA
jgi:hypothetical protein